MIRRFSAALPGQEAARSTHLSGPSLTRVETTGTIAGDTTLAELERLAGYLGVPTGDLLAAPDQPAGPPDDDTAALGGLLGHQHRLADRIQVAAALGWTLDRLRTAQNNLDTALRPLGLHVHEVHHRIGLRPADASQDDAAAALAGARAAGGGMSQPQAGMVRRALDGTLRPNTVRKGDLPALAELVNLGVLEHVHRGGRDALRLTNHAAHAFDVDTRPGTG